MPIKFEWDLDPGSIDLQSCFHLDHVLNTSNGDTEVEFYSSPGINLTLPNDDIWKKFGMTDEFVFDDELDDLLEDVASVTWMSPMYTESMAKDARELRNHDCMWAGHCISEKHDSNNQKIQKCVNLLPVRKPVVKSEEPKVVAVTTQEGTVISDGSSKVCVRKNAVVAPTHARSILLPSRVISAPTKASNTKNTGSNKFNKLGSVESIGESPRPETPQSLTDNEDLNIDLPDIKTMEEYAVDTFGYNFVSDIVNNVDSDVSNPDDGTEDFDLYLERMNREISHGRNVSESSSTRKKTSTTTYSKLSRTNVKQEVPVARHYTTYSFFSDHCYHLSKNARMDNLGVQTPSDSEEEIDVETVYGESKRPSSRSSSSCSGGVLPTNPSFSDRQQLQITMASAINKKDVKRPNPRQSTSTVTPRLNLDDRTLKQKGLTCKRKTNVRNGDGEVRRTGCSGGGNGAVKRSAQFDDYNEYLNKPIKRKKYQYQRTFKTAKSKKPRNRRNYSKNSGAVSSESEMDSSERRTIHNCMERQRRIGLRNAFEELRKLVPFTAKNEKAPKVVILSYGAEYCKSLTLEEAELTRRRAELRRQQEMLRAKVSQLRRSLAARR